MYTILVGLTSWTVYKLGHSYEGKEEKNLDLQVKTELVVIVLTLILLHENKTISLK